MRIFTLAILLFPMSALAGNGGSTMGIPDSGLGGDWNYELSGENHEKAIETIVFAKDYNTCMDRADSKNNADHDRCDKNKSGDACHDKADKQYEENRASCERVAHSDNLKETGKSWSGPKPTGTTDRNGSADHPW
jgi:hypothetical protein